VRTPENETKAGGVIPAAFSVAAERLELLKI
jgi:hypothetical protein